MMYLHYFLIGLAVLCCGKKHYINNEFSLIVKQFESDTNFKVNNISIDFNTDTYFKSINKHKDDTEIIGICLGGSNTIFIKESSWKELPQNMQIILIYHELGHCLLNREHNDNLEPDGSPQSIMNSLIDGFADPLVFQTKRKYYIDELVNNR